MNDEESLRCERIRLLLSLAVDGEATPDQQAEIADHLPGCTDCAEVERIDLEVRAHLAAREHALPAEGFGGRVAEMAAELHRSRMALRRMLVRSAAAATLIGAVSGGWLALRDAAPAGQHLAMVERTKMAVIAPHTGIRR